MSPELVQAPDEHPMRVAIADDSPLLMDGVARALGDGRAVRVVVTATSGGELLARLGSRSADVVIIDPWMTSGDGLDAIQAVSRAGDGVTVVALSAVARAPHVDEALARGADGYIGKDVPPGDLGSLVRRIRSGILVRPRDAVGDGPVHSLTRREREVLGLVAEGLSNRDVGDRLFVTEQTVKFHLANIYRKLGVGNRTEAASRASALGIVGWQGF